MKRIFASILLALVTCCALAQVPIYTRPQGGTSNGVPQLLHFASIPIIGTPTGTITAPGAITLGTALDKIYPRAFCYLPANAVATVAAAAYYYCTFTSTTVGTVCLDQWTSGVPTPPVSCTPVTDGKGAYTGDTTEEFMPAITVPALATNSQLRVEMIGNNNNSAGTKNIRARLSGQAGTVVGLIATTTTLETQITGLVTNAGKTNEQLLNQYGANRTLQVGWVNQTLGVIDTTATTSLVFSMQRNTATDYIVFGPRSAQLFFN